MQPSAKMVLISGMGSIQPTADSRCARVCVCMYACVRACMRVCVHACVCQGKRVSLVGMHCHPVIVSVDTLYDSACTDSNVRLDVLQSAAYLLRLSQHILFCSFLRLVGTCREFSVLVSFLTKNAVDYQRIDQALKATGGLWGDEAQQSQLTSEEVS